MSFRISVRVHRLFSSRLHRATAWWRTWNERQLAAGLRTFQRRVDPSSGRISIGDRKIGGHY